MYSVHKSLFFFLYIVLLSACHESAEDTVRISSLQVYPEELLLEEGERYQLQVNTFPSYSSIDTFVWSSNNKEIASVAVRGVVMARKEGNAQISVSTRDGGFSASCQVRVIPKGYAEIEAVVGDSLQIPAHKSYLKIYGALTPDHFEQLSQYIKTSSCKIRLDLNESRLVGDISRNIPADFIPSRSFQNCDSLAEIKFPKELRIVGEYAFYQCRSIVDLHFPESLKEIKAFAFNSIPINELKLPGGIKVIGSFAFAGGSFKYVDIPREIESVAGSAFNSKLSIIEFRVKNLDVMKSPCRASIHRFIAEEGTLNSNNFPEGAVEIVLGDGGNQAKIDEMTIYVPKYLERLILKEGVVEVKSANLLECLVLKYVYISKTVTLIEPSFLRRCYSDDPVVEIDPDNAVYSTDGHSVIENKKRLLSFFNLPVSGVYEIPEGIEEISYYVFCPGYRVMNKMTELHFPSTLKSLSPNIFDYYQFRKNIYVKTSIPLSLSETDDWQIWKNSTLHVPKGSLEAYRQATGWKNIINMKEY